MKSPLALPGLLLASILFNGCIERTVYVDRPVPVANTAGGQTVATQPPPPPQTEVVTTCPGPDFIWISGYWGWSGNTYVWFPGYWGRPPHPHAVWVGGYWGHGHGGWYWRGGYWR